MTHTQGSCSRVCPPSSSHGCSGPMAGATSAPWGGGAPSCCAPPRAPLTLRGSSGRGSGCRAPASASPAPSSTCTRGRLLLRAPSQPCPPAGSRPCQHPAHPRCTLGPAGAGAPGRASPPAEKLPNLPFQSAALGTHAQKANTDGKPRCSLPPLPPARRMSRGRGRELCLGGRGRFSCRWELILSWRIAMTKRQAAGCTGRLVNVFWGRPSPWFTAEQRGAKSKDQLLVV